MHVIVKNESGDEACYAPADDAASGDSDIYFTDVWSPDEEHLVLPRGRSEGFCILKAAEQAMLDLRQAHLSVVLRELF
jgi:hypothetical protein